MSKSAIFKEFEHVKILKKYVTVSRKSGLIISMPESEKRNLLVKCFDKETTQYYEPGLKERYEQLDLVCRAVLPEVFLAHDYPVSGDAMRSFRRHLIITILRKEKGFEIEQMVQPDEYSALLLELVERISALTGVAFSQDDMADCQRRLNGLNTLDGRAAGWRDRCMQEYEQNYEKFRRRLKEVFGLEFEPDREEKQNLYFQNGLAQRQRTCKQQFFEAGDKQTVSDVCSPDFGVFSLLLFDERAGAGGLQSCPLSGGKDGQGCISAGVCDNQ